MALTVLSIGEILHPSVAQRHTLRRYHGDDQSHAITSAAPLSCRHNSTSHPVLTSARDAAPARRRGRFRPLPALGGGASIPLDSRNHARMPHCLRWGGMASLLGGLG